MQSILILGVDTTVGANLAAAYCERFRVVGAAFHRPLVIEGCEAAGCRPHDVDSLRLVTAAMQPRWIIHCGPGSVSTWESDGALGFGPDALAAARNVALVARESECPLTLISSDAVFTGPWMFHDERSGSHCPSEPARLLRTIEETTARLCPQALIVRTNAFGWSPASNASGWLERTIGSLEDATSGPFDCFRHATPILATDLADALERAFETRLQGLYHVAGAERTNPARFVEHLADVFGLPQPASAAVGVLERPASGFGCGETSLKTRAIREALGFPAPTLTEGLVRLYEQSLGGFRDKFHATPTPVHEMVA